MEESGRHVAIFTAMTNDVLENACKQLLVASTHFCSQLLRIFAPGSCTFCSRIVLNFALGSYAILLLARTQFCSWLVRNFAPQPPLVPIFALQPLLVRATYRATVGIPLVSMYPLPNARGSSRIWPNSRGTPPSVFG